MALWMRQRSCFAAGHSFLRHRRVSAAVDLRRYTTRTDPSDTKTSEVQKNRVSSAKGENEHSEVQAAKHQVKHRAQETLGMKFAASVVERVTEVAEHRIGKAAVSRAATVAERATAKALAKQAAKRASERASRIGFARLILRHFPAREAVARIRRGLLISVPVVGAAFAAWIGKSDLQRTLRELELARTALERERHEPGTEGQSTPGKPIPSMTTAKCFGVATVADLVNVVTHLSVAYGLYQGWEHETLLMLERASLTAAFVSTVAAVGGELSGAHRESLVDGGHAKHDGEKSQVHNLEQRTPPQ